MRKTLTSSVALITYNGGVFIEEQLKSIIEQTHPPDEIIVSDDASTDDTLTRIKRFAKSSPITVSILNNTHRLGVIHNIEHSIQACHGDIIFLCDQDDVWLSHKIESYLISFEIMPDIHAICSDAQLVDRTLRLIDTTLWQSKKYSQGHDTVYNKPYLFRNLLRSNLVCGATLAFRKNIVRVALPIGKGWMHDEWIGALCAGSGSLLMIHKPTMLYRQHARQEIGINSSGIAQNMHDAILMKNERYHDYILKLKVLQKTLSTKRISGSATWKTELNHAIHHYCARTQLPRALPARIHKIVREIVTGNYHKHSSGIPSILKDIFINR